MKLFNFMMVLLDANQQLLFSEGKSWTVIIVMSLIWIGIVTFLVFQERRIKALEDRMKE